MDNLIFLDTETTGTGPQDRLLQLAYKQSESTYNELYKPPVPITLEAMSVCHITEKMVADRPAFIGSFTHNDLKTRIAVGGIVVAHNAPFDIEMLKREGIEVPQHICTLKVARYIDQGGKYGNHKLQYLRYFYGIELDVNAHDALADVLVLEKVFEQLYQEIYAIYEGDVIEEMLRISKLPSVFRTVNFGKYAGKSIADIAKYDRGYLEWLLKEKCKQPKGEEDWIYTLEQALK